MRANQLLLAATLATAIGAPIETLAEEKRVVQLMGVRGGLLVRAVKFDTGSVMSTKIYLPRLKR